MHVCKRACDSTDDVHIDMTCHRSKPSRRPATLSSEHVWFELWTCLLLLVLVQEHCAKRFSCVRLSEGSSSNQLSVICQLSLPMWTSSPSVWCTETCQICVKTPTDDARWSLPGEKSCASSVSGVSDSVLHPSVKSPPRRPELGCVRHA